MSQSGLNVRRRSRKEDMDKEEEEQKEAEEGVEEQRQNCGQVEAEVCR